MFILFGLLCWFVAWKALRISMDNTGQELRHIIADGVVSLIALVAYFFGGYLFLAAIGWMSADSVLWHFLVILAAFLLMVVLHTCRQVINS